jgi:hypothetical protein
MTDSIKYPLGLHNNDNHGPHHDPTDLIGAVTSSPTGNSILRIGRPLPNKQGWEQVAYVVLDQTERDRLVNDLSKHVPSDPAPEPPDANTVLVWIGEDGAQAGTIDQLTGYVEVAGLSGYASPSHVQIENGGRWVPVNWRTSSVDNGNDWATVTVTVDFPGGHTLTGSYRSDLRV